MTIKETIEQFKLISTPDTISPETLGNILLTIFERTEPAFVSLEIEQLDTFLRIWVKLSDGQRINIAQISAMDADKAGLFTPTRLASILATVDSKITAALAGPSPLMKAAITNIEIDPQDTYCKIWVTTAGGTRVNIAQIPAMDADKAGLFTPTRLAAINLSISTALTDAKTYADTTTGAALTAARTYADTAAATAAATAITGIEFEPRDTFGRIWATIKNGTRTNIAQIPAMSDDKAGLFTPSRLASILATVDTKVSTAVNKIDNRVKAIEDLIRGDADMTVNKLSEVVTFLEGVSDQTTLLGMFEDIETKLDNVEDKAINNTDEIASRWQAPTFVTLDSAVSGNLETSGYAGKPTAYAYHKPTGHIVAKVMPAVVEPTTVPKYYEIWEEIRHADIRNRETGIGYIPAGSNYLLPYPGRMYVFADDTGIWVTGADGKLRKIADICECTADKNTGA